MDLVPTIIGYALFAISELFSILPIPTNGILQTFILGFKNAFSNPPKDIEMAQTIAQNPSFANIVNVLSQNTDLKGNIDLAISNPQIAHLLSIIGVNPDTLDALTNVVINPGLLNLIKHLNSNPQMANNVIVLTNDPNSLNNVLNILQNPSAMALINNKNAINSLANNNALISTLPYITAQNATNLQYLVADPSLSNTVYSLNSSSQKPVILDTVNTLLANPDIVPTISNLVTQAVTPPASAAPAA